MAGGTAIVGPQTIDASNRLVGAGQVADAAHLPFYGTRPEGARLAVNRVVVAVRQRDAATVAINDSFVPGFAQADVDADVLRILRAQRRKVGANWRSSVVRNNAVSFRVGLLGLAAIHDDGLAIDRALHNHGVRTEPVP